MSSLRTEIRDDDPRSRAKRLAKAAVVHLVWIVLVLAGWAGISYVAFQSVGEEAAFAIAAVLLVPAGVMILHGGHVLSDRLV